MTFERIFFNRYFDKNRLKSLILWSLKTSGEKETIELLEKLKNLGFQYATKAGISLGIDDLKIPPNKANLISEAEAQITISRIEYEKGHLTHVERFQQMIDIWNRTSETLKQSVIENFRLTDILNPVYMMAFSGARGNISQVRQLVGMRGLMADPQGQILEFPIKSNFREGLTLTEYIISCFGARKGLVDTALRTANSGYLTRRLVDVSQHIIVRQLDCGTERGIFLTDMKDGNKIILRVENRITGRVLAENISNIAKRNQDISPSLAAKISKIKNSILVRSPLTCEAKKSICQLCYGWSLAHGNLVSLGEAVGILAAQSIGEPGTQLTMRTFHTGGVFSADAMDEIRAPFDGSIQFAEPLQGLLIRTIHGKIGFFTKVEGIFSITCLVSSSKINYKIPSSTVLFIKKNEAVFKNQLLAEYSSLFISRSQSIQSKYNVNSTLEGEVFFENVNLALKKGKDGDRIRTAIKFGSLWVLSGKIYHSLYPSNLYPNINDIVDKKSIMNQITLRSPYSGKLHSTLTTSAENKQELRSSQKKFLLKKEIHQTTNTIFSLNIKKDFLILPIINIKYKQFVYFLKFENFLEDKFVFFNSLNTKYSKIRNKEISFKAFPNIYKTKIGGFLLADRKFLNNKKNQGQVFLVNESFYTLKSSHKKISRKKSNTYSLLNSKEESTLNHQKIVLELNKSLIFTSDSNSAVPHEIMKNEQALRSKKKENLNTIDKKSIENKFNSIDLKIFISKNLYKVFFYTINKQKRRKPSPLQSSGIVFLRTFYRNSLYQTNNVKHEQELRSSKTKENLIYQEAHLTEENLYTDSFLNSNKDILKSKKYKNPLIQLKEIAKYKLSYNAVHHEMMKNKQELRSSQKLKPQWINQIDINLLEKYDDKILRKNKILNCTKQDDPTVRSTSKSFALGSIEFNKKSRLNTVLNENNTSQFELKIKYGWVYFLTHCAVPHAIMKKKQQLRSISRGYLNYNEKLFLPGYKLLDHILFDQHYIYVQLISNPIIFSRKQPKANFYTKKFKWKNSFLKEKLKKLNYIVSSSSMKENRNFTKILFVRFDCTNSACSSSMKNEQELRSRYIQELPSRKKKNYRKNLISKFQIQSIYSTSKNFIFQKYFFFFQKTTQYNLINLKKYKKSIYQEGVKFSSSSNKVLSIKQQKTKLLPAPYCLNLQLKLNTEKHLENEILNKQKNYLGSTIPQYLSKKYIKEASYVFEIDLAVQQLNKFSLSINQIQFKKPRLLCFSNLREIKLLNFMMKNFKTLSFNQNFNTKNYIYNRLEILEKQAVLLTSFLSPYEGEIIKSKIDETNREKQLIVTKDDKISFSLAKKQANVQIGQLIRYGEEITHRIGARESGQVIQIDKEKITLRKALPLLFSSKGIIHVNQNDLIEKNTPLVTLFYDQLKTGDIVQGIPKIEELFEARQTKEGAELRENLHSKLKQLFEIYKQQVTPQEAARISIEKIQQLLVNSVQQVYQSQGVTIADKHIEIIVRQMTAKVKIIDGGRTGLLRGELIDLEWVETVNLGIEAQNIIGTQGFELEKAEYEPIILGITKAALETESFISAASFQETTRILGQAAIERKTDFLRGLKENVILGHLIPAGTGFSLSFDPQIKVSGVLMKLSWLNYKDMVKLLPKNK
uniref:DNA-directed RNA polymerase subunit beta'' n=1 Tax=Binuclearia lauterbornii TaxID=3087189 RepID=A0A097KPD7_9CHLO|nr:beta'' subunit of RNA polymerase [Binuclearia lauterbornii]AIT95045.1 beta'' subunit of RNA polymerase [Binuclearia lauterbornii]